MRNRELPLELRTSMRRFYRFKLQLASVFDEKAMMAQMAPPLRRATMQCTIASSKVFANIPLFAEQQTTFIMSAVLLFKAVYAIPDDIIFHEGDSGTNMCRADPPSHSTVPTAPRPSPASPTPLVAAAGMC